MSRILKYFADLLFNVGGLGIIDYFIITSLFDQNGAQ